jgi:predicted transcriptional regulator
VLGAWLAYDPDETLAQFFARKKDALAAGDQAWRDGTIKAHHQKLYERLVDAVGAHQYSWIKVETLAAEFKTDESTIKRWLTVLEKQAKLIRRQRQFKTSSRTYVVAYDQHQAQAASDEQAEQGADTKPAPAPTAPEEDAAATGADDHAPQTDAATDTQAAEAVFFERTDAPTYSALLRPEVKDLPLNTLSDSGSFSGVNGGTDTFDITTVDLEIRAIIDHEGVTTDRGKNIVAARPAEELRAVQGYLDHQTNVRDRSGLFVWLNERQFGAELLAGRAHAPKRQPTPAQAPSTPQRRRRASTPPTAHGAHRPSDHDPRCAACGHISAYLGVADACCEWCGVQPGDELGKHDGLTPDPDLWHTILAQLDIAPADRNVWLAPTMLAHYDDLLVLACPHKLVGEAIHTRYRDQIDAATSAVLGRPAQVEITVKYMPNVTEAQRTAWLDATEHQPYPAWLHDDEEAAPPTHAAHAAAEQQDASRSEAAAPRAEAFTPAPHVPTDQDNNTLSALPYDHQESKEETCVPPLPPSMQEVWTSVLNAVPIPANERQVWLEPTALRALGEDCATIHAPNIFVRNRIAIHYHDQLAATLSAVVGRPLHIEVVTGSSGAGSHL